MDVYVLQRRQETKHKKTWTDALFDINTFFISYIKQLYSILELLFGREDYQSIYYFLKKTVYVK